MDGYIEAELYYYYELCRYKESGFDPVATKKMFIIEDALRQEMELA